MCTYFKIIISVKIFLDVIHPYIFVLSAPLYTSLWRALKLKCIVQTPLNSYSVRKLRARVWLRGAGLCGGRWSGARLPAPCPRVCRVRGLVSGGRVSVLRVSTPAGGYIAKQTSGAVTLAVALSYSHTDNKKSSHTGSFCIGIAIWKVL